MEKQEKKTTKVKTWWDKNKGKIADRARTFAWYAGGFILGSWATNKMMGARVDAGLHKLNADGYIKFFDPAKGVEVNGTEFANMLDQMTKKK